MKLQITCLFILCCLGCASPSKQLFSGRHPASAMMTRIPVAEEKLVTQRGQKECGPAAIYNAFVLGTPNMQAAIGRLEGATSAEKYQMLIANIAHEPSEQFAGRVTRTNDGGTWIGDMRFMIQELLGKSEGIVGKYLTRPDGIYGPGEFLEKTRAEFERSVAAGVPVIMAVSGYKDNKRIYAHYLTVTAISKSSADGKFQVQYVDPAKETDQVGHGYISESMEPYRAGMWEIYRPPGETASGKMKMEQGNFSSPFLLFSGEMLLNKKPIDRYVVEQGFGVLSADY